MKLDAPKNKNYAAVVVRIGTLVELEGLNNLIGIPVLGYQALTQRGKAVGDLAIAFTAETQLSEDYSYHNDLYRDPLSNKDHMEKGYLERNRRIRAIKLRGYRSDALLMPLSSVEFTGVQWWTFEEGDTFDTLNGHDICRKYEIPVKPGSTPARSKIDKAFRRVDKRIFPEHLDTDNYFRSKHLLKPGRETVQTQKLHGTSIRVGNVPVLRQKGWFERLVCKLTGIRTPDYEYDVVYGSRKVIKDVNNPNQNHFYGSDLWSEYGKTIAHLIPQGYIVYGELIGWKPGTETPLQANYTYNVPKGEAHLYVYRVAHINANGIMSDLSWDGVRDFCLERGLMWVPELCRGLPAHPDFEAQVEQFLDARLAIRAMPEWNFTDDPLPLSDKKTVDEGICLRQEGLVPTILKAKSPKFLEHETKLLDSGEADLEAMESVS